VRARIALLLLATGAAGGDEVVDIVPAWKKGDVCDLVFARTFRLRGKRKVGNVERALTVERDDEAVYRDKVLATTARGAPGSIERKHVRARSTTVTSVLGLKSEKENETDPVEGTTATVDIGRKDAFLVEMIESEIYRKGAKVGETWEGPKEDSARVEEGKLVFKLVEMTKFKERPAARIYVMFKAKVLAAKGKVDIEAKGYVYFSLELGRIVRSNLRGPVKLQLDGVGTVHGTMSEEATLTLVEAGK
jgi:hypothetical protein